MGKGKRYKVVLKGYEITEEGTGAKFNEASELVYHNMPYEKLCLMEKEIMGAFTRLNDLASAEAAASGSSTSAPSK